MRTVVHPTYSGRQALCTWGGMYSIPMQLHPVYMARNAREKRVQPRFKPPLLRRTFIRDWRLHRGKSLEELAEAVGKHLPDGFTHASLSRIERQKQPYSQPVLEALAIELNTTVAALLSRRPGDAEFWTTYERLPEAQQEDVARYMAYVAERGQKTGT